MTSSLGEKSNSGARGMDLGAVADYDSISSSGRPLIDLVRIAVTLPADPLEDGTVHLPKRTVWTRRSHFMLS